MATDGTNTTHTLQERYSSLVLAKIRQELVLKDGVIFNNDYEAAPRRAPSRSPCATRRLPFPTTTRPTASPPGTGGTAYETMTIDKDKGVNEIIDGYDAAGVPDNLVADRLDSAGIRWPGRWTATAPRC